MRAKPNFRSLLQQYSHIGIAALAVISVGVVACLWFAGHYRTGANKDVLGSGSSAQHGTDSSQAAHTNQAYDGGSGGAVTSPSPLPTGGVPRVAAVPRPPAPPNAVGSGGSGAQQPPGASIPGGQPGEDASPGQGSGAGSQPVNPGPSPVSVPKPVVFEVLGRRNVEIPISSSDPWIDSFATNDGSPVTWTPQPGDEIYWEGQSIGVLRSPAYMILSGGPGVATATLAYKIIVNDVIAKPNDVVTFSVYIPEFDQTVTLRVTIAG